MQDVLTGAHTCIDMAKKLLQADSGTPTIELGDICWGYVVVGQTVKDLKLRDNKEFNAVRGH